MRVLGRTVWEGGSPPVDYESKLYNCLERERFKNSGAFSEFDTHHPAAPTINFQTGIR